MNKYVLITGATSGIGYELAKIFAREGYNLILVARNNEKLLALKNDIQRQSPIKVLSITEDLSKEQAGKKVFKQVKDLGVSVDILINNAGAGYVGAFLEKDYEKDLEHMRLNMMTLTELTKLFGGQMVKNGGGKILNIASTGSYHPGPYTAVYYATKAYVLSLSEALHKEFKPFHVSVSALCPGATKTNFAKNAGKEDSSISMSAEFVAQEAYKGLIKNKKTIIPGIQNKLFVKLPRSLAARLVANYQKGLQTK